MSEARGRDAPAGRATAHSSGLAPGRTEELADRTCPLLNRGGEGPRVDRVCGAGEGSRMALVPETPLFPCARCSELLRVADPVCPHCGATRSRAERTGPLVALAAAFAMAACGASQPEYGVPDTERRRGASRERGESRRSQARRRTKIGGLQTGAWAEARRSRGSMGAWVLGHVHWVIRRERPMSEARGRDAPAGLRRAQASRLTRRRCPWRRPGRASRGCRCRPCSRRRSCTRRIRPGSRSP